MTTVTPEPTDQPIPTSALDGAVEEYSRDKVYVLTAIFLAIVTLVEVATYFWEDFVLWSWGGDSNAGLVIVLMVLMAIKFFVVAWVFMHLKFDKPILNRVFFAGLLLAVAVYLATMAMFRIFWSEDQMIQGG
jgi:hypothetical protein